MTIAIILFLLTTNVILIIREVNTKREMRRIAAKAQRVTDMYAQR